MSQPIGRTRNAVKALLRERIEEHRQRGNAGSPEQLRLKVSLRCLEIANSLYRRGF